MTTNHDDTSATTAPDRDAARTLTYEGTDIRQRGRMLNLTDMWRAAGNPPYRRPAIWLDMEETKRFRTYARWRWSDSPSGVSEPNVTHGDIWQPEKDGLVVSVRGHGGGTWAHWQLALAYARYLSPAFHTWCNAVVRNAMERHGGPPRGRDALMRYMEHQFDRLHRKLDHLDRHAADQMFLLASAQELIFGQRREFSPRSRSLMCELISAEPYEGQCPCCCAAPVLGADSRPLEGAEFDHAFHRGLNRPEHGWLICKSCHVELTQGGYLARFARMADFRRFQGLIVDARKRAADARADSLGRVNRPAARR